MEGFPVSISRQTAVSLLSSGGWRELTTLYGAKCRSRHAPGRECAVCRVGPIKPPIYPADFLELPRAPR